VPVLADIRLTVAAHAQRAERCARRYVERGRERLEAQARLLPTRDRLLGPQRQRLDDAGLRADRALERRVAQSRGQLDRIAGALRPATLDRRLEAARQRLADFGRLLAAVDPDAPLQRGYARVTARGGATLTTAAAARGVGAVTLHFRDGNVDAKVEGAKPRAYAPATPEQPSLL